jgi:hypothetical protein
MDEESVTLDQPSFSLAPVHLNTLQSKYGMSSHLSCILPIANIMEADLAAFILVVKHQRLFMDVSIPP